MRKGAVLATLISVLMLAGAPARAAGPFADWAAVVVAGDWRAHDGGPTEAFDNARRDVAATLPALGFSPDHIRQFSTKPDLYPDTSPARTKLEPIYDALVQMGENGAGGGCFFYYTSHGGPPGVVMDYEGKEMIVPPPVMADLVNEACPGRPAIIVISACYSGVFVPALAENDRMILTAARPDRSSFGCGAEDKYPYFDECFLKSAHKSASFAGLGPAVQACVRDKEVATGARPPSEPQVWIGPALRPMLPLYAFPPSRAPTP